jgi:hypothetical protein
MSCGKITRGAAPICPDDGAPLKSGTEARMLLINYDDLVSVTESTTTPNLLTALTLATNQVGYIFQGVKQDVKPTQEFLDMGNSKHMVNFLVPDITQLQKNNLQRMARNGRLVAVVENKGKNSESFEVYGLGSGMAVVPGLARDPFANGGAYIISLATPEGEDEPLLPQTLFSTDYATTLALVYEYAGLPTITNISDLAIAAAGGDAETITGTNFFGNGTADVVSLVQWINQSTLQATTQTATTTASDTSITFTSVALTAGLYKLRITTLRGVVDSTLVVKVS